MAVNPQKQNRPSCPALWITQFLPLSLDRARQRKNLWLFYNEYGPLMSHMTCRKWYRMIMSAFIFPRLLVKRVPHNSACLPDCTYLTNPFNVHESAAHSQLVCGLRKYLQLMFVFQMSALRYLIDLWLDMP